MDGSQIVILSVPGSTTCVGNERCLKAARSFRRQRDREGSDRVVEMPRLRSANDRLGNFSLAEDPS
jgi:hypothetical protein